MATKTFKVSLSLDNPRIIQSGINVHSFDKQSIKITIELTKNSQVYQIPTDAQIKISLLKLARQEQKIILDVPFTSSDSIEWVVPDYLDGYQGEVRVGVYLIVGTENIDVGYFNISSKVSDIDSAAEEFTESVLQGWAIEDLTALLPQFQAVLDETTGKDVISAPEIILARGGEADLKTRLDKEHQEVTAQLAQTGSGLNQRIDNLVIPISPENVNVEVTDAHVSTVKGKAFKSLAHRFSDIESDVNVFTEKPIYFSDNFNRANGPFDNKATFGEWFYSTSGWLIESNRLKSGLDDSSLYEVYANMHISDIDMSCDISFESNSGGGLCFRLSAPMHSDSPMLYYARINESNVSIFKYENPLPGTTIAPIASVDAVHSAGVTHRMRIVAESTNIKCFINDILVIEVEDGFNLNATRHGIGAFYQTGTTFDNFEVKSTKAKCVQRFIENESFILDLSVSDDFTVENKSGIQPTISFINVPKYKTIVSSSVKLINLSENPVIYPPNTFWEKGELPVLEIGKTYLYLFISYDNGKTWLASCVGGWSN